MNNKEFEEYFLKYKNLVMRIVMNKTGDYQLAQEICQQAFMALYRNRNRIEPEMVKAWLIRCAQNAVVDHYRREGHKDEAVAKTTVAEQGNTLVEESIEIFEEHRHNKELLGNIFREVRKVNEQWYEVLVLSCVDGMTYGAAAKQLNIPEGVLRTRMHRARAFIRERFGEEYDE